MQKIQDNNNEIEYHQYIIIGAGIAGLQAASILAQYQQDFIILQASNQIGGRIRTDYLQTIISQQNLQQKYNWLKQNKQNLKRVPIQSGATWVSIEHSYLLHMIQLYDLRIFPQYSDGLTIYGINQNQYNRVQTLNQHYKNHKDKISRLIDKIDHLTKNLELFQNTNNLYKQYVNIYDNMKITDFLKEQLQEEQLSNMIIREIQTLQCISLEKLSVLQMINDSGSLQLIRFYSEKCKQTIDGYRIKQGSISIINHLIQEINTILNLQEDSIINQDLRNNGFLKLNSPVKEILNQFSEDVIIKATQQSANFNKQKRYSCRKVLFSVPIATSNRIKISRISQSKKLLFDNQQMGKITRKYMIFKEAFWRVKFSGYGSFSNQFPFNQMSDLSPTNLSCGILALVFVKKSYEEFIQKQFSSSMQNPQQAQHEYFLKIISKMFLNGDSNHQYLQDSFSFSKSFNNDKYIQAGYQATTKPNIWKKIEENGDDYYQVYSRDQYDIIYIGSEYDDDFPTYMEGAIRQSRKKAFKLLEKEDPWINIIKNKKKLI